MSTQGKSQYRLISDNLIKAGELAKAIREASMNASVEEAQAQLDELINLRRATVSLPPASTNQQELFLSELRLKFGDLPDEELITMEVQEKCRTTQKLRSDLAGNW